MVLLFDFSRVLLFPKDKDYQGSLNEKHRMLSEQSDYQLFDHFELNLELLAYLDKIKTKYNLYIFTTETIQDDPNIQKVISPIFKDIFSAIKLGLSKKDPEAYKRIAQQITSNPEEILFIDDSPENIEAAKTAGLQTLLYKNNNQIYQRLS